MSFWPKKNLKQTESDSIYFKVINITYKPYKPRKPWIPLTLNIWSI